MLEQAPCSWHQIREDAGVNCAERATKRSSMISKQSCACWDWSPDNACWRLLVIYAPSEVVTKPKQAEQKKKGRGLWTQKRGVQPQLEVPALYSVLFSQVLLVQNFTKQKEEQRKDRFWKHLKHKICFVLFYLLLLYYF